MNYDDNASDILDMDINDLPDLQGFAQFIPGEHRVTIKWDDKVVNDKSNYELSMTLVETVSIDGEHVAQQPGTEVTILFNKENDMGLGKFKAVMIPLSQALGTSKVRELMEQSTGMEVLVKTKWRYSKDDKATKENPYTDIVSLAVI